MRQRKYRIGQIPAGEVSDGDILMEVPFDGQVIRRDKARPAGTVVHVRNHGETRSWMVRTASGVVKEWPEEPVGRFVNTYVHVPWGQL